MAQSVSRAVREILSTSAYLHFPLENRLLNDSAVANFIKLRVEEKVGKKVPQGAVTAAVRRFTLSFAPGEKTINLIRFLKSLKIQLRTGLVEVNLKRSNKASEKLALLAKKIKWEQGEKMYVLQRAGEITVIANKKHLPDILACAPKKDVWETQDGRAVVNLVFDPKIEESSYGGAHFITGVFAYAGVVIHQFFSTYSADSFVIKEKDVSLVYRNLSEALNEIHALYPEI